jgi:simple sugar transport system ATP-binding protein
MPLARRQQLEILRVLAVGASILVLDEPTAVLSPIEARRLFQIVRRIVAFGRSVVLITHKLNEVLEVADDIVVMRGGRVVHVGLAAESDPDKLARLIVGERVIRDSGRPNAAVGDTVLAVDSVTVNDHRGVTAVRNASFVIRAGELVVIAGVTGNGQTELIEAIGGMRPLVSGAITAPTISGRRAFAYIPAQNLGTGLAPDLSVRDNAILGRQRHPPFGRWLARKAVNVRSREVLARFSVKADGRTPVRHLSGGNLQRVVLGRELLGAPLLILADYPTRGLDVAAAAQIRAALIDGARSGAAVLMSSEELDESLGIATRILVMHRGEIITDLPAADAHVDTIGRLMTWGRS